MWSALSTVAALTVLASSVSAVPPPTPDARPIEAVRSVGQVEIPHRRRQLLSRRADGDFDVLHHLAGDSPYFNSPGVGLTNALPTGCNVTHAAYLVRHGDIYANDFEYENQLAPFLYKLGNFTNRAAFSSSSQLAFLANWTSPLTDPEEQLEKVTPYGKADARVLGALVAQRYPTLVGAEGAPFRVFSGAAERDVDTSKAFVQGFNSTLSSVDLVIVEEGEEQSANTLTPHESCEAFSSSRGSDEAETFLGTYGPGAAARLKALAPSAGFNWTQDDVFAAQAMCGYEVAARNASDFCALFEEDEWLAFEYANDLHYHRQLGYGSDVAPVLGIPWLRASARLLDGSADTEAVNSSAGTQKLWVSFTHREEPPFIVTALGLYNSTNASMPTTSLNYARAWRTSYILPFLANVALERLSCSAVAGGNATHNATNAAEVQAQNGEPEAYVRVLVNQAPVPVPGCDDGPGASCPVANFSAFIESRAKELGTFASVCGDQPANGTETLGVYEGLWPANGTAVEVRTVPVNGSLDADVEIEAARKKGTGSGSSGNSTSAAVGLDVTGVWVGAVGVGVGVWMAL